MRESTIHSRSQERVDRNFLFIDDLRLFNSRSQERVDRNSMQYLFILNLYSRSQERVDRNQKKDDVSELAMIPARKSGWIEIWKRKMAVVGF